MSSSDLILITGATGHLGFRTLTLALEAGYTVRAAVRSEAKGQTLFDALKRINVDSSNLSTVIVPDLGADGAYTEAIKGAKYVIHIASAITAGIAPEQYEEYFMKPASKGTINMLEAAQASGTVKRVVVTSSVVAIIPFSDLISGGVDKVVNEKSRIPTPEGPYPAEFAAYSASKAKALNDSEAWMKENKPEFDLVNIHPSFIEGRDDLVTSPEAAISGTNRIVLATVLGQTESLGPGLPGVTVHNDDVARLHVDALKPTIPGNASYLAQSNPAGTLEGTNWEDANKFTKKHFPEAVEKGILPSNGKVGSIISKIDSSKTEEVFGFKFQSYEEQVKSVVGHYLELVAKA